MKKNLIKLLSLTIAIASVGVISGCDGNQVETETVEITDMVNDVVTVKKNPRKVACVSRTSYDLLMAFGLEEYIDGAYEKTLANPWSQVFAPSSANHFSYEYQPSAELLLSRGVDLVFAPEQFIAEAYREQGITAITMNLYGTPTFDAYLTYIPEMVMKLWDDEEVHEKANKWITKVTSIIDEIQTELAKYDLPKEKLFYIRGDKDKGIGYTDTMGSFVEYAYRVLGFNCMSSSLDYAGSKPSAEAICEFNPDVFIAGGFFQHKHVDDLKNTEPYNTLEAVKNNRIYTIPIGFTQMEQVNIFTPEFFCDQANKLYPDIFNYDVASMLKNSTKEWFNIELSNEQVQYILNGLSPTGESMA